MPEDTHFSETEPYSSLAPEFLKRFGEVLEELDPLGIWRAKHSDIIHRCLSAIVAFYQRLKGQMSEEHQQVVTDALFVSLNASRARSRVANGFSLVPGLVSLPVVEIQ